MAKQEKKQLSFNGNGGQMDVVVLSIPGKWAIYSEERRLSLMEEAGAFWEYDKDYLQL